MPKELTDEMVREYFWENWDALKQLVNDSIAYNMPLVQCIIDDYRQDFDEWLEAQYGNVKQWEY